VLDGLGEIVDGAEEAGCIKGSRGCGGEGGLRRGKLMEGRAIAESSCVSLSDIHHHQAFY
jgi:hypothetical protein